MGKVYIENLNMIITNKCNLNCAHCMRGCKNNSSISKEVADATINQLQGVGNLYIGGGEITLALDSFYNIVEAIKKNDIEIHDFSTTINGTIYSSSFLEMLKEASEYVDKCYFYISSDIYHNNEIERLDMKKEYIENLKKYRKSSYYYGMKLLNRNNKIFDEGNAELLSCQLTSKLSPMKIFLTYINEKGKYDKNGICNIGPLITINPSGVITEYGASIIHQEQYYNYGNVLEESILDNSLKRGKVMSLRKYNRACSNEMNRYFKY